MISNRGLNVWNLLVCKLIVHMTKSQKPQEATNILIIDENMGKHRIEALEFPKLRQQDASTSLKSIFGKLEHHGITKQHACEKMASFTADGAAVNMGQHARIKALILGINAPSTS